MGHQVAQGALFYAFRLDDHLPADHLLKRIDGLLDFGFVRETLAASYSSAPRRRAKHLNRNAAEDGDAVAEVLAVSFAKRP
ncbi:MULTISPECIES: hypothetical protein [unclassified Sphingomonas]|uniref:hypothetical protein n=1 Tax=unclassified Sphingomonas TaxID=196159 RepID=UPI00226A5E2C|nr:MULTISPECIES: hypothetical protein [unclassified Sphingomonas]